MKFSENWLRSHVSIAADSATLERRLTMIGLEVEGIEAIGAGLEGVVVAKIVAAEKHPEADRLQVCAVDAGTGAPLQIVCGAPNARPGLVVPLATVGASLPGGIAIKAAKLRGVESFGMLCSAKELGIDADASGLLELPDDAPIGKPLTEVLGLPDNIIELGLTPNRADCFCVRGIAFDVAAAFDSEVATLDIPPVQETIATELAVQLHAGADAPRYCGRVIEGVNATVATPLWMRERLRRAGIRPVSFLVDVTQYVMLEIGQPMHAFDRDTLKGAIGVRKARTGEVLKLLDGRQVPLDGDFLVITDTDRAIALAGVMGGFDTRVTDATKNIFLEAAHFAPAAIIGRSRKLGMHTDAAHRFERGVDPQLPRIAIERATALIQQIAGGNAGPVIEASLPEHLSEPAAVVLRRARLSRVLGSTVADDEVERILRALGMTVVAESDGWTVTPPSRRFDIAIEEDLIEEVARIHGYDAIPLHAPAGEIQPGSVTETRVPETPLRAQLAARGFFETLNFAFLDANVLSTWKLDADAIPLANPLSAELAVMRTALLPGLVEAMKRNTARQIGRVRLFEMGRVFHAGSDAPQETIRIAAAACGTARAEQWGEAAREVDFHDLRGDLDSLLALTGQPDAFSYVPATDVPWLHPGRAATLRRGDCCVGHIGHLHPALLRALDIDHEVVVFELAVEVLCGRNLPTVGSLSRQPSVRRDLAILVADEVSWARIEASLRKALGEVLREVIAFDVYRGKGVADGSRSIAMGLILQDDSRTLVESDVEHCVALAVTALQQDCGAVLRG